MSTQRWPDLHYVSVSFGVTSWAAAKILVEECPRESVLLGFSDTLIEAPDTYRFGIEGIANVLGLPRPEALLSLASSIPDLAPGMSDSQVRERREGLRALRKRSMRALPGLLWLATDEDPWDVFLRHGFIGNTRVDICSRALKRDPQQRLISAYLPDEITCYVGFTQDEEDRKRRFSTLRERKLPYVYRAPLIERGISKEQALAWSRSEGIEPADLYQQGYPHGNCGGGCVKAGLGAWTHHLAVNRGRYLWWEEREADWQRKTGRRNTILRSRKGGKTVPLSLRELRRWVEDGTDAPWLDADLANPCGDSCIGV